MHLRTRAGVHVREAGSAGQVNQFPGRGLSFCRAPFAEEYSLDQPAARLLTQTRRGSGRRGSWGRGGSRAGVSLSPQRRRQAL